MENIEKVKLLFEYLAELSTLRNRIVTDVNSQEWKLYLEDVPKDEENIQVFSRDVFEDNITTDSILLSVTKPDFYKCPKPPKSIVSWLKNNWDNYKENDVIKEKIPKKSIISQVKSKLSQENLSKVDLEEEFEFLSDSEDRVLAVSEWLKERGKWSEDQKRIEKSRDFFSKLYMAYTFMERESEKYEFVVGNGIIRDDNNKSINHPTLLKRVKFKFDSLSNTIKIEDTDTDSILYSGLLKDIDGINHGRLQSLQEILANNYLHPFDKHESKDFLHQFTNELSDKSKFLFDEKDQLGAGDIISVRFKPVFFIRKRLDGTAEMISDIREDLDNKGFVKGYFSDLVGSDIVKEVEKKEFKELSIDERLAATSGENIDILLSKEANREQLEIAERIQENNAVVVQGPPGTGKTHTIANLLGHFLAEGKTVLVTSHTTKALSVLKGHIPKSIQDLCVTVLGDSNEDMVASVNGITNRISKDTSVGLERKIKITTKEREEIIESLSKVRRKIYTIKNKEFKPIVYGGNSYSPSEAADFVSKNKDSLNYIPGRVEERFSLPVSLDELSRLYQSNESLSAKEEKELRLSIPDPESLMTKEEFNKMLSEEKRIIEEKKIIEEELMEKFEFDFFNNTIIKKNRNDNFGKEIISNVNHTAIKDLKAYIESFSIMDDWMIQAAVDGKNGGGHKKKWEILIKSIEDTFDYAESVVSKLFGYEIIINDTDDLSEIKTQLEKLSSIYASKGRVGWLDFFINRGLEEALMKVSINGYDISSQKDCELALLKLKLIELSNNIANYWDPLMSDYTTPMYFELGTRPWELAKRRIPNIKKYLNWHEDEYMQLLELLNNLGLDQEELFNFKEFDDDLARTSKILKAVNSKLPKYLSLSTLLLEFKKIKLEAKQLLDILTGKSRKGSNVCLKLSVAVEERDLKLYGESLSDLSNLYKKYSLQEDRNKLLSKVAIAAPDWALAIRDRKGLHGNTEIPKNIQEAWKWKQFERIIDELMTEPLEALQKRSVGLSKDLRKKTEELAADKAWYNLILRTEQDISLKQNLTGWKITVEKIGKGYGKRVAMLRNEARKKMEKSQKAVPAWIMPMSRVYESFKVPENVFDILIIDEASQSDLTSLAALYLAKKVIIVGDNKQVSPLAVGISNEKTDNLRDGFIRGKIPNWDLYDATTSLYDIAGTTFNPIMLKEHFRCVPEIIGYSNRLSYDYEIKPLRDAKSTNLSPAVVSYRAKDGQRDSIRKINVNEAKQIVALMKACIEQPEYKNQTFGVISLVGSEQAELIERMVIEEIPMSIITEKELLFGDASSFQGDERDVIFISLVDSNEEEGPLRMVGPGRADSTKQRYNVAASRARNQLWVVHSLDQTKDLKTGDLRKGLIEYANNPSEFTNTQSEIIAKSDSPFEEEVAKKLVAAGYNIVQQWSVGSYRLDMVAQYKGNKVAIECDGERWHSGAQKVREDMERQTILERIGWTFIRLRGSEYYIDKEAAIKRVIDDLTSHKIYPESMISSKDEKQSSELLERVKNRADQILNKQSNKQVNDPHSSELLKISDDENSDIREEDKELVKDNANKNIDNIINENNVLQPSDNNKALKVESENNSKNKHFKNKTNMQKTKFDKEDIPSVNPQRGFTPVNFYSLSKKNKDLSGSQSKEEDEQKNITVERKENNKTSENIFQKSNKQSKIDSDEELTNTYVAKNRELMAKIVQIEKKLKEKGIEYARDRELNNILWVRYSKEARRDFEEVVVKFDLKYTISPRGSISSNYLASWRVTIE